MHIESLVWHADCSFTLNLNLPASSYTNMNKTLLYLAIAMLSGAASALALPTTLDVDFRSAAWQAANGNTTYSQ